MPSRPLRIVNVKGLHARASARLVEVVERFAARATVRKDGLERWAHVVGTLRVHPWKR